MAEVRGHMTRREREARRAFTLLGSDRVLAFVRALRLGDSCMAAEFINDQLDEAALLEAILFNGGEYGYQLSARSTGAGTFHIKFGCLAGPTAGDGGEWNVEYDSAGGVVRPDGGLTWIS